MVVDEVGPVAGERRAAAEVGDERGAGAEFVRPPREDVQTLVETLVDSHVVGHAPDGEASGVLVVRHHDVLDVALREVELSRRDAREIRVVDRQEVDVLGNAGV